MTQYTSPTRRVLFRCDASFVLGLGHVYRCLTLASALHLEGWDVQFATNEEAIDLIKIPFDVLLITLKNHSEKEESYYLGEMVTSVDLLIIDHYEKGAAFEEESRKWANQIFVIDDLCNRKHNCDYLLDQTVGRDKEDYRSLVPANCTIMSGSRFAILRTQFPQARFFPPDSNYLDKSTRLVIAIGGTDPNNMAARVLNELVGNNIHLNLVIEIIGSDNLKHNDFPGVDFKLHTNVSNMAYFFSIADVAIGAGGVTALERCCLGLPSLIITTAANQSDNIRGLINAGAAVQLGDAVSLPKGAIVLALTELLRDSDRMQQLSIASRSVCDGLGTRRVLETISPYTTATGETVKLVDASRDHVDVIFKWQNELNARVFSRNSEPPSYETHIAWMEKVLHSTQSHLSVVLFDDEPCGVVRVDANRIDSWFEVSILIATKFRSRGIGKSVLSVLIRRFPWAWLYAEIHPDNKASVVIFQQCGFKAIAQNKYLRNPKQIFQ